MADSSAISGFESDALSIERSAHVGTLWLDRPEKRNAMGAGFWDGLPRAVDALMEDGETRAIVLAARGKSFSVGLDLAFLNGANEGGIAGNLSGATANLKQLETTQRFQRAISAVAEAPVPVICAVHGFCLGGGLDISTACDVRLASRDAVFGVRETRIGIVADVGTLQRLPTIVTAGHMAELVYTGKDIDATRAEKIGLVNDVYEDAEATYQAAFDMATEIAANAPLAVRGTKFILAQGEDLTTEQSLLLNGIWTMITTLNSKDLQEAMKAFVAKRPPAFKGH